MDPSPTSIEPQQQQQQQQPSPKKSDDAQSEDYAPYPKLDPIDISAPPPPTHTHTEIGSQPSDPPPAATATVTSPQKSVRWSPELTTEAPPPSATSMPRDSNPYVAPSPAQSSSTKNTMETVRGVLGRWGKKAGEATKKAEDLAGNFWQHLKTGPSVTDAAMGRIAQGSKVLAEGGYEKIFRNTFEILPEEKLKKSYASYLSTSAGPVMGVLYLSTAKLAFCSDSPLSYKVGDQTEWSYYKVVIPLHQVKSVNASASKTNRAEKYIQVTSVDGHEFWFMGFVNYDSAVEHLREALEGQNSQSV